MDTENKTAIFYITDNGLMLAKRLGALFPDAKIARYSKEKISKDWASSSVLICIMATGIVVRSIAPLIKDKKSDPAVIVLDEKGEHVISLLSGHLGGANRIAQEIADFIQGRAVITTASDINNLPAIDLWAKEKNLEIENWNLLAKIGTKLINKKVLQAYSDITIDLPACFLNTESPDAADIIITNRKRIRSKAGKTPLLLRPKNLVVGIGCNTGTETGEIAQAVGKVLCEYDLSPLSISAIATIDIKAHEQGLVRFSKDHLLPLLTYGVPDLNNVEGISPSKAALKATGAQAVAEPSAILASGHGKLLVPKQKIGNVTVAVAEKVSSSLPAPESSTLKKSGKIFVVGTGPGNADHITPAALQAIRSSDVIVGYGTYLDLIRDLIASKEVLATGMTQEVDRCARAIELASEGKTVAIISGGDPGIYAMAGLVLELLKNRKKLPLMCENKKTRTAPITHAPSPITVEIVPGISALNACSALLGAPLMHDFAAISLSDRLTPWDTIEARLSAAAEADFVIALYNPKSKGRAEHISRARDIILQYRSPATPVGIIKAAMRSDERVVIADLETMLTYDIDMQTTVIIGNSKTFVWNNFMITPRGYEKKARYQNVVIGSNE